MDSLHQRLLKSFEYLKDMGAVHTVTQFADVIKKPRPNIANAMRGDPKRCTTGLMKTIADAFPDVLNRDYLLAGEGDVAAPDKSLKPHFEAKASAGFMDGMSEGEVGVMRPPIPGMPDYDFTIEVNGDSMLPRIESGDVLLCRTSDDRLNLPIGKICVIDSIDGAAVKVIVASDDECITLHSLNPDYDDYKVGHTSIGGIAKVVGLIRRF